MRSCGQSVYSQWVRQGISCARLSTVGSHDSVVAVWPGYNPRVIHRVVPGFSYRLSTAFFTQITSVVAQFIPTIHTTYNYKHEIKKGKRI